MANRSNDLHTSGNSNSAAAWGHYPFNMQLQELKAKIKAAIKQVESVPQHTTDDSGQYEFAIGPDELESFSHRVTECYIQAATFGFMEEPPAAMLFKADALFYLRQLSAWLDSKPDAEFLTVEQAAERLQVSKDSVYDLVKNGLLDAIKVGRTIRIKPSALEQIHQDDGW
ncbi:MAG: helix-turn-helix domain-containing protein [Pirellulales bacterium]|nr:helix-turn-helix domain-containing protein [Pirellulales bacterium]